MKHLITSLLLCSPLLVGAQSQLALDTTSTQDIILVGGAAMADGDRMLALRGGTGVTLWRATAYGDPVWARRLNLGVPYGTTSVAGDGADGLLMLQTRNEYIMGDPGHLEDTLRMHFGLARVAADGHASWTVKLSLDMLYSVGMPLTRTILTPVSDGTFIVAFSDSWPNMLSILKVDAQGQFQWARSYDNLSLGAAMGYNILGVADASGGAYLVLGSGAPSMTLLVRVLHDGSLDWAKTIKYTNAPVWENTQYGLAPLADGSVQLVGRMVIPDHQYLSTVRVSPEGAVTAAHFYGHPATSWESMKGAGIRPDGSLMAVLDSSVISLGADGAVLAAATMTSHVVDDQRNRFIPKAMNVVPEGVMLAGTLDYVHVDLGYTHHRPAMRTVDPAVPACYLEPISINHVPVPVGLYEVGELANPMVGVPIQVLWSDTTVATEPMDALPASNLCEVMIYTAVETVPMPPVADLRNTLAQRGQPFYFANAQARRVSVLDATGRLVSPERLYAPGTVGIATDGWPVGMYVVRVSDPDGASPRVQRVVVSSF